ncbi:hypothetical protein [Thalassotalea ganghwensis]
MNTQQFDTNNDDLAFELSWHNERNHSKRFRDKSASSSHKKISNKKSKKKGRPHFDDDYDDDWS